jgi:hypothetical protein
VLGKRISPVSFPLVSRDISANLIQIYFLFEKDGYASSTTPVTVTVAAQRTGSVRRLFFCSVPFPPDSWRKEWSCSTWVAMGGRKVYRFADVDNHKDRGEHFCSSSVLLGLLDIATV